MLLNKYAANECALTIIIRIKKIIEFGHFPQKFSLNQPEPDSVY